MTMTTAQTAQRAVDALHNLVGLADSTKVALFEVACERTLQDKQWGQQDHSPMQWLSVLGEEFGEVCQAANTAHWNGQPWDAYRGEMVQVAAVALAAIECLDRNGGAG